MQGLVDHLQSSGHVNAVSPPPPPRTSTDDTNAVSAMSDFWNDPQYLFPTYENDPLLFDAGDDTLFDRADLHEDDNDMDGFHVIPESKIMLKNIEK